MSWFTIKTAAAGIELFVSSWNEHPIPGTSMCRSLCFGGASISVN